MSYRIVFSGVDGKVGTTMIAQSVAEMIAGECKDMKVLLTTLHGRPGIEYAAPGVQMLEKLRIPIESKILSKEELLQYCKGSAPLYQLGGVKTISQRRKFKPDTASTFLEIADDAFDLIVIDAGNELDDGLAIGAIHHASDCICVLTQQETILARYEAFQDVYRQLGLVFCATIVNLYDGKDEYDLSYVSQRLSVPKEKVFKIEKAEKGRQAEKIGQTLLAYHHSDYCTDVQKIADLVLQRCGRGPIPERRIKKWKAFL